MWYSCVINFRRGYRVHLDGPFRGSFSLVVHGIVRWRGEQLIRRWRRCFYTVRVRIWKHCCGSSQRRRFCGYRARYITPIGTPPYTAHTTEQHHKKGKSHWNKREHCSRQTVSTKCCLEIHVSVEIFSRRRQGFPHGGDNKAHLLPPQRTTLNDLLKAY